MATFGFHFDNCVTVANTVIVTIVKYLHKLE